VPADRSEATPPSATPASAFLRSKGRELVVGPDDRPVLLRGVGFFNHVDWLDHSTILDSPHHGEEDFVRVAGMGMNVIRFMLDHRFFTDEEQPDEYQPQVWQWLDRNLAWARKHGLWLLLDLQIPPGGKQEGGTEGRELWRDEELRTRLVALWTAIAERYAEEPAIAGYDLVNEPCPEGDPEEWQELAQELIDAIRKVDPNHLVVVEKVDCRPEAPLLLVEDDQVLYDAHFYFPHHYSHMYNYGHWGDGGRYPDEDVCLPRGELAWLGGTENPTLPLGESDWILLQGKLETAPEGAISVAPVLGCGVEPGRALFDDFLVEEFDGAGQLVRSVHYDLEQVAKEELWRLASVDPVVSTLEYWKPYLPAGETGRHESTEVAHHGDTAVLLDSSSVGYGLNNAALTFWVVPGHAYRLSVWGKSEGISGDSCGMGLEFFGLAEGASCAPLDRAALREELRRRLLAFGEEHQVPLNVGEFGLMHWCFASELNGVPGDRGGLQWTRDVIELLQETGVGYQWVGYRGPGFGLFSDHEDGLELTSVNQPLVDVLRELNGVPDRPPSYPDL